jgi:hypothetical protein
MKVYRDEQGNLRNALGQYAKSYSRQFEEIEVGSPSSGRVEGITEPEFPNSTRVQYVRYDYDRSKLAVKFFKLGRNLGLCYVYDDVPPPVYMQFVTSDSLGKYINSVLNSFSYHPADDQELELYFYSDRYSSPDPQGLRSKQ